MGRDWLGIVVNALTVLSVLGLAMIYMAVPEIRAMVAEALGF